MCYPVLVSMNPKFQFLSLDDQPFSRYMYRQFWDKCTEFLQNDLETYKVKCTQYKYELLVSLSLKFHSVLLYDQSFLSYRPFWDKWTELPSDDLEHYKVKGTPYVTNVLESLISPHFFLYDQPFWDTKLSIIGNAPNALKPWTLNSQKYPVCIKYLPPGSTFCPFHSTTSCFQDKGCWKSEKSECTEWPQTDLQHLTIKNTI